MLNKLSDYSKRGIHIGMTVFIGGDKLIIFYPSIDPREKYKGTVVGYSDNLVHVKMEFNKKTLSIMKKDFVWYNGCVL